MDPERVDAEKVWVGKQIKLCHLRWPDSLKLRTGHFCIRIIQVQFYSVTWRTQTKYSFLFFLSFLLFFFLPFFSSSIFYNPFWGILWVSKRKHFFQFFFCFYFVFVLFCFFKKQQQPQLLLTSCIKHHFKSFGSSLKP